MGLAGWLVVGMVALAGVVAACLAWARNRAVIREIDRALMALADSQPPLAVVTRVSGRLGRLARRVNVIGPALRDQIDGLARDVEQMRVVLASMAEGVIAIDARHRLLFANRSAEVLFGIEGRSIGRLLPELVRSPDLEQIVVASLGGPAEVRGEISLPTREPRGRSGPKTLAVQGSRLPLGSGAGAVLVFHDITDLRRLERMRQDFVANASHELKTPLAAIKAYTETLLDWALHDEKVNARFLNQIDEQADRLHHLIIDLLSLARLEAGSEVFEHAPLAIRPAIEDCTAAHQTRAESNELGFEVTWAGVDDATRVVADEEAIRQILDNLLDNAIKYTPKGGRIAVRVRCSAGEVVVEVADTGIGIPRDDLPRVFERFYRVDKARSRELGGTGLGLSIVKHLAHSLGGRVEVASRVGEGTTFTVSLPEFDPPG